MWISANQGQSRIRTKDIYVMYRAPAKSSVLDGKARYDILVNVAHNEQPYRVATGMTLDETVDFMDRFATSENEREGK